MIISTDIQACYFVKKKLVVVKSHLSALYNNSQFVHLNREKGEEAAVTSNGHSGERRCSSSHTSGKEASLRQSFAVGRHVGER